MRLLLAEDEKSLSRAVTVLLRKSNYEVDSVYDGEEALAYLSSGNYDGAILDIMMPKVDGIQVLRQLRGRGGAGCRSFSSLPRRRWTTRCWAWTAGPTTTSPSPSPARSCWPGSGP